MRKRVVFVRSNAVNPDPRVERAARALKHLFQHVTVLAWDRTESGTSRVASPHYEVIQVAVRGRYGSGMRNIPHLFRWWLRVFGWLIAHEWDVVHACDFDGVVPSVLAARLLRRKIVYDIFDWYSDMAWRAPDWLRTIIREIDRKLVSSADAVILCDEARIEQLRGARPRCLAVVYNTPEVMDATQFSECDSTTGAISSRQCVVCYIGLLERERGLLQLLDAVANLEEELVLLMGGWGPDEELIRCNLPSNAHWLGRIAYTDALRRIAASDVLVALYDPRIPNHQYASPNKLYEAMAFGKPIVVADDTLLADKVRQYGMGLVVSYGCPDQLRWALSSLARNTELRRTLGENARRAYLRHSWTESEKELLRVYHSLADYRHSAAGHV